jgi:hypothetical protein
MPRLSKIGAAALAAFGWTTGASAVSASYLQIAGGGPGGGTTSAGNNSGAGGGAGGYLTGTTSLSLTTTYTVTVGAGGAGTISQGTNGSNSQFGTLTASVGGGAGGSNGGGATYINGLTGGSGGGGSSHLSAGTAGSGTSGQGSAGGNGSVTPPNYGGGGGGGASAVGTAGASTTGGNGGAGSASSITGTSVTYAGGGGGATYGGGTGGTGGSGGGGAGASNTGYGTPGTANLGGGGGGACLAGTASQYGGNGGSGVVIISYLGAQQFGGGVVTSVGGNTIHTFNTSGTLSPLNKLTASALIVAGGGGGSYDRGGGGGAGGLQSITGQTIDINSTYVVTVGSGGAGATTNANGSNGTNSTFSVYATSSVGGGGGASYVSGGGSTGGSGGGGSYTNTGGAGTSGQGNAGGNGESSVYINGGGGGGAGAVGQTPSSSANGGNGGNGTASSIPGSSVTYAGGGGGGHDTRAGGSAGTGGSGGGGAGGLSGAGTAGTANTGGGGGGGGNNGGASAQVGGAGGSGIVIISYAGATQQMAGGTITITGGNVIHTFTSSGYLTPLKLVNNSLRFRNSATGYLSRTPLVSGSKQKFTISTWIKRGVFLASDIISANNSAGGGDAIAFQSSNGINVAGSGTNFLVTTQVFRDPSAWYHIVLGVDTTQATSSDRIKLYVNGVQVTSFSTASYPAQNYNFSYWNTAGQAQLICNGYSNTLDGYLSEFNFIDGQALTPNSFGTFNSYGVWQPITYGGSYGTNGFYLPFKANQQGYTGIFNGSTQYLSLTSTSALVVASSTPFTLECFVNFNNFTSTTQYPSIVTFPTSYQLYVNNSGVVSFYNGTSDLVTGTIVTSVWNHIAVSRDASGNLSMWINGVRKSTTTGFTSSFGSSSGTFRIASYNGTGGFVSGYVSNLRFVNGTAIYDPTQPNITVPTTTLTAVTNTALLTLQNATFVDNSTNAFSITNNGSTTTGQTYPMSYNVQYDQSPQGNNWTPNNISGITGSTLDYMTDVPTLTSATVANYAVLNPLSTLYFGGTLSNGNLNLNYPPNATNTAGIASTIAIPSGTKIYFELVSTTSSYPLVSGIRKVGTDPVASQYLGYTANEYAILPTSGNKYNNNTSSAYGVSITSGDILGCAVDLVAGKIYWSKNGTWMNSGDPAAGTNAAFTGLSGDYFACVATQAGGNTCTGSVNFGQQPWIYSPPSGFVALNTYNI